MFVDSAKILIISGKGGNGAVSFRKEPYVPEGGPDGGDGGDGGNVVFKANENLRTLMDFRYKKKYQAENGQDGMRKKRYGKNGEDLIIEVPVGTVIIDNGSGLVMKDLTADGDSFIAAKGGKGGKGNVKYTTSTRQAPNFAEAGGFSKERNVTLEMKLIADVGLVGFPNVGKSTLLSVSTSAKPKIGNYHFTTITPNLGVVEMFDRGFVMADIAGIVEGAHEGVGLGHNFLKHIERTKILIHVVDVSGSEGRDPIDDFKLINSELQKYAVKVGSKPQIVAANKMDIIDDNDPKYIEFKEYVIKEGYKIFPISSVNNQGIRELMGEVLNELDNIKPEENYEEGDFFDIDRDDEDPDYKKVSIQYDGRAYNLSGKQLYKIFNSTNFTDLGSLRYLYKFIENSGAIDKMKEMGIDDGDIIKIKDYEMEYTDDDF